MQVHLTTLKPSKNARRLDSKRRDGVPRPTPEHKITKIKAAAIGYSRGRPTSSTGPCGSF